MAVGTYLIRLGDGVTLVYFKTVAGTGVIGDPYIPYHDISSIGGTAYALGQQAAAGCAPVVLPSDQVVALGQATMANSVPVVVASDQVGTAGTAAANVFTVQGIASMTPLLTTATISSGTVAVSSVANTISTNNSTTATLGSGGVFTGTADDVTNYDSICVQVFASHASASLGLSLQFSTNNSNWDFTMGFDVAATTARQIIVPRGARYFRIVYTNGGTGQTSFRLQTILSTTTVTGPITTDTELPGAVLLNDNITNPTTPLIGACNLALSGSVWVRLQCVSNGMDDNGIGVLSTGICGQYDDVTHGTVTENQFAPIRMSSRRSMYIEGNTAHDAADTANPLKVGAQARTTNPTAVADADISNLICDKLGKLIAVGAIRTLKAVQKTTITSSTAETTIVTAVASTFLDLYGLTIANTSGSACNVTIKDATSGTTRMILAVPPGETRGFMLPVDSGIPQASVNNNWTATCSASVASIEITALTVQNL